MKEKKNDATPLRPEGERSVDAPMVTIDLLQHLKNIREESSYNSGPRNAITLFKSDQLRIVLIALHAGGELPTHTADGTISVQVIEGQIIFSTQFEKSTLTPGQLVTLHKKIPHSVLALEESAILLTLSLAEALPASSS
jgi:quercetin dioxygenase-like cupin family protein